MFIKKIIIDGFKSYAQRTEVGPFDPQFNAITGLNGSGKSNILDSICFLLGISNLSQVRAGSLQELVYKGGQAGVIKATVTITFDNTDKHQSPVGYDSFDEITVSRQVVIGGRNKYLINGSNALPSRVQDLFRSVQLNVNNPHFLIMQGRITKVLNMKPPEILSMIEEAAGTRMYENKREAAQKTIEKKDSKLAEIDKILTEEITPTLKKLKEERSSYLEYQKVTRELEHLSRLLVAYHFTQAEEQRKQSALDLEEAKLKIKQLKENAFQVDETISEVMRTLDELRQQKQREESDGPLQELEKKVDQSSKLVAVAEATLKDSKQQLSSEKKSYQEIMKSLKEDEDLLEKKTSEISSCQDSYQTLQQKLRDSQKALVTAQQHFQAVSSGLSSSVDGQSDTLAAQKIAKENEISAAQTQIKQAEMRLKSMKAELKEKEKASSSSEHIHTKDKTAYDNLKKEIAKLDSSLSKLQYQEGHLENLMEKKDNLKSEIAELRAKVDHLESRFPHLQFDYSDPHTGFDRSKVKGPVAKVLHVNDVSAATALEVTAGGKLYHVIVDTEETGKQLLQNGKLKRRYTIIPLNKITARCIANDVVKRAQQIVGSDKVRPALSLVDYDSDVQPAMKYVFGTTFVCNTLQDAKQVTFDKRIMTRSVALAGDVFDPSGTLTGGSRAERSTILVKLQELKECEDCLQLKLSSLAQLEKEIKQVEKIAHKYTQMKDELESKYHDAELIWARVEQSTYHQQLMQVEQLKESIESQQDIISQAKDVEAKAMKQLQEIEHKIENSKGLRDQELKEAEEMLTKAKMEADKVAEEARTNNQGMEGLQLEVVELESSISSQKMQVESTLQAVDKIQSKVSQNEEALTKAKGELASAVNELNEYKAVLKGRNKELQQHEKHLKELESRRSQCTLAIKENEHKMSSCQRDSREADKKVDSLVAKYDWITTDKQYFGQPNTAYDFKTTDPREAEKKTNKLQEQKEKLSRHVNMRAMNMLGKAEEKYNDLMRKKKIVENDKSKIAELIAELDQKKNEALQTAWKRVNQDFGSIFSTLLPGTSAKLSPPQGQSVLDGLEVKVAFGDVWKESLSELSGGQKSLVALSLILSLLLFKPAPLYILDEVDAALDLSHTQNIGQMLRTHFHHSQFIVVSLKNGMFNNANVLFKTKFVDGISTVTRYENPKLHSNKENDGQEHSSRKALKS